MKRRVLSVLSALCVTVTLSCTSIFSALPSAADSSEPIRILAMGDSITDGYIDSNNGYRKYLCYNLQQQDFTNFDMVGPNCSWTNEATYDYDGTTITYDPAHAGYSGYAIEKIGSRSGLYETIFDNTYSTDYGSGNMIQAYDPDIVLLQIGTNDILDAQNEGITDRLEKLVDAILKNMDGADDMLFVASIPDIDVSVRYDWLNAYNYTYGLDYWTQPEAFTAKVQESIDNYNDSICNLVAQKQAEGAKIRFADINSVVDMKTGLYDGVHPNESGYSCMGKYWSEQVLSFLNQTEPITTTSTTQTTETVMETTSSSTTTETTTIETTSVSSEIVTTEETTFVQTTSSVTETFTEISEIETTTTTQEPLKLKGDVSLDGQVNVADVVKLCRYLIREDTISYEAYQCADMTDDGVVNGFDLSVLRQQILQLGGLV